MSGKESFNIGQGCQSLGRVEGVDGQAELIDMAIGINGQLYTISVATPGYIRRLQDENKAIDPDSRRDENILPISDLSDPERVCRELHARPLDSLRSFLRLQNPQDKE